MLPEQCASDALHDCGLPGGCEKVQQFVSIVVDFTVIWNRKIISKDQMKIKRIHA